MWKSPQGLIQVVVERCKAFHINVSPGISTDQIFLFSVFSFFPLRSAAGGLRFNLFLLIFTHKFFKRAEEKRK